MPVGNPNPKGSKPDKLMRDAIIVALHREANDADGQPTKKLALVAAKLVEKAIEGDVAAIKEVADRVDGKSVQQVDANLSGSLDVRAWLAQLGEPA